MFKVSSLFYALLAVITPAAEPKLKPRHDPPDQLFRCAPMAQSTRSVAVNFATNLHYAFDTDLARVHTIWRGGPLDLWGRPYSYAKAPFICDFAGDVLFSFPQVTPWWSGQGALRTRFRGIETVNGEVTFSYEVLAGSERVQVFESVRGSTETD